MIRIGRSILKKIICSAGLHLAPCCLLRRAPCLLSACLLGLPIHLFSQSTRIQYLSGTDKDHTVPWDFYCTEGRGSGEWTKIAVPSNWELQGFGSYNYGHDKVKANEQGLYKYSFYT